MRYFIAFDGGGTKIESVLFDEYGHIIKRYTGEGGNATDIGKEEALRRLDICLQFLLENNPVSIYGLYGGMAGVCPNGDFYSAHVRETLTDTFIRFEDDGCILISGGIGPQDGCGMVCGTGSSLFIRIAGQPLRHIGGKGYLIDTGGSGFDLGQHAIRMALRAVDGRIKPTILTNLLEEMIGMPINDAVIPVVHRGGRPFIASFAKAVFQGRKMGDAVCEEIFQYGAAQLADLTFTAEKFFDSQFPVVMGGGVVNSSPEYFKAIKEKSSERAVFFLLDAPPVYGAAVEAMTDANITVSPSFKEKFLADFYN